MSIFKKNGEINFSRLSEFMGFNPQKIKCDLRKVRLSTSEESKERNQKQYEALVLGGLAMYAGLTQEELVKKIKKPIVTVMIGIPCSGKSTYIKENLKGFKVVSFDNSILELFETDNYNKAYKKYSELSSSEKKNISLKIKEEYLLSLLRGENIAIDFTSVDAERMKSDWVDIIPHDYRVTGVMLRPSMETVLNRNLNRKDKFIPVEVLKRMEDQICKSNYEDIFDTLLIKT